MSASGPDGARRRGECRPPGGDQPAPGRARAAQSQRGAPEGRGPVPLRARRRGGRGARRGPACAWEIVPGVSSAFGVPAVAGIPVTHRGLSSSVTVVTGRVGDPVSGGELGGAGQGRRDAGDPHGHDEPGRHRRRSRRGGKPASTPTAVIERGTHRGQAVVRTTLGRLAEVTLGSPSVIVVGPVAALGLTVGSRRPGRLRWPAARVVVTRSGPRGRSLVDALQRAGAEVVEVPLTEQAGPGDGGAALRGRGGGSRPLPLGRLHVGQRGRAASWGSCATPGRWAPPWSPQSVRPPRMRCARRAWSPIWCRPSTGRPDWSPSSPTSDPARRATWSCSRAPSWLPPTHPRRAGEEGLGGARASMPTGRSPLPPPEPAGCWTGWRSADAVTFAAVLVGRGLCRPQGARRRPAAGASAGDLHRTDHGQARAAARHDRRGGGGRSLVGGHRCRTRPEPGPRIVGRLQWTGACSRQQAACRWMPAAAPTPSRPAPAPPPPHTRPPSPGRRGRISAWTISSRPLFVREGIRRARAHRVHARTVPAHRRLARGRGQTAGRARHSGSDPLRGAGDEGRDRDRGVQPGRDRAARPARAARRRGGPARPDGRPLPRRVHRPRPLRRARTRRRGPQRSDDRAVRADRAGPGGGGSRRRRPERHDGRPGGGHPRRARRRRLRPGRHPRLRRQVRLRALRPLPRCCRRDDRRRWRPAGLSAGSRATVARRCSRSRRTWPRAPT